MLVHTRNVDKACLFRKELISNVRNEVHSLFIVVLNAEACVPFRTGVLTSLKRSQKNGSLLGSGKVFGRFTNFLEKPSDPNRITTPNLLPYDQ